jgi:hypothetical protein
MCYQHIQMESLSRKYSAKWQYQDDFAYDAWCLLLTRTYGTEELCNGHWQSYNFSTQVSYPFGLCFTKSDGTTFKYVDCDGELSRIIFLDILCEHHVAGSSYTLWEYSNAYCQLTPTVTTYSTINTCVGGVKYTCQKSTPQLVNYGYIVASTYHIYDVGTTCTGSAQSTVTPLGVCIVSSSKTSATMYTNYSLVASSSSQFTVTTNLYSGSSCGGSQLAGYPVLKTYTSSCSTSSGSPNAKYYSSSVPGLSEGVLIL